MSAAYRNYFTARPCPCGESICKKWVINHPELRLDTETEAKIAAALLNALQTGTRMELVPYEPTPEMLDAAGISRIAAIGVWRNMLSKVRHD